MLWAEDEATANAGFIKRRAKLLPPPASARPPSYPLIGIVLLLIALVGCSVIFKIPFSRFAATCSGGKAK